MTSDADLQAQLAQLYANLSQGIDAQIAHGDTFHTDCHPDLKADWVMANPPHLSAAAAKWGSSQAS